MRPLNRNNQIQRTETKPKMKPLKLEQSDTTNSNKTE
jgi:hypothetical protein